MRKILTIILSFTLALSLAVTSYAATNVTTYTNPDNSVTTRVTVKLAAASETITHRGIIEVGSGYLDTTMPWLIGNPYGYAYTEAYNTAYMVGSKVDVNSQGYATSSSGWQIMYNTKSSTSNTITAYSRQAIFDGYHQIQPKEGGPISDGQSTEKYE